MYDIIFDDLMTSFLKEIEGMNLGSASTAKVDECVDGYLRQYKWGQVGVKMHPR